MRSWKLKAEIAAYVQQSRVARGVATRALNCMEEQRVRKRLAASDINPKRIPGILRSARVTDETKNALLAQQKGRNIGHPREYDATLLPAAEERYLDAHHHRTIVLRRKLRALNLAYGYLLGYSLDTMEVKGGEPIPFGTIHAIASRYGGRDFDEEQFIAWVDAVEPHTHPQPRNIEKAMKEISALRDAARKPEFKIKMQKELSALYVRAGDAWRMPFAATQEKHHVDE